MKLLKVKKNRGFTVVETLVAISILSLSVVATFAAVQGSLQDSSLVKDQITAFYLAQEAVEYVKAIRADNSLKTLHGTATTMLAGIPANCLTTNACTIDSFTKQAVDCLGDFGACQNIKMDTGLSSPTKGLMGYTSGWTATPFKREIKFSQLTLSEYKLTVKISWVTRGANKSFQITESLFSIQ